MSVAFTVFCCFLLYYFLLKFELHHKISNSAMEISKPLSFKLSSGETVTVVNWTYYPDSVDIDRVIAFYGKYTFDITFDRRMNSDGYLISDSIVVKSPRAMYHFNPTYENGFMEPPTRDVTTYAVIGQRSEEDGLSLFNVEVQSRAYITSGFCRGITLENVIDRTVALGTGVVLMNQVTHWNDNYSRSSFEFLFNIANKITEFVNIASLWVPAE